MVPLSSFLCRDNCPSPWTLSPYVLWHFRPSFLSCSNCLRDIRSTCGVSTTNFKEREHTENVGKANCAPGRKLTRTCRRFSYNDRFSREIVQEWGVLGAA